MNVRNPDITGPPTATLSGHRILAQREHIKNASTYPALTGEGGYVLSSCTNPWLGKRHSPPCTVCCLFLAKIADLRKTPGAPCLLIILNCRPTGRSSKYRPSL